MASAKKQIQLLARQYFKLSLADGVLSSERVGGVLEHIAKHRPANTNAVLKAYQRLVAAEFARGQAVVEHAGALSETTLSSIANVMGRKYNRPVSAISKKNDALIAGVRVRIGDDTYESSVAGQLAALSAAV
ncbi:MAG: hypothetical protein JWM32_1734 [Verrucomicrobia bacterium]|nr:hypothetical protein [Verrucomicrobiota bacterium]